jgi:hypothetical protein
MPETDTEETGIGAEEFTTSLEKFGIAYRQLMATAQRMAPGSCHCPKGGADSGGGSCSCPSGAKSKAD